MPNILLTIGIMFKTAIRLSTPIIYAAIGGSFSGRSGVMALGLEGFMLFSAFGAAWGSYLTQNPWLGLLFGVIFGILLSLIFGILCVTFSVNQVIAAIGTNMFASGITATLTDIIWGTRAYSDQVPTLDHISLPFFGDISVLVPLAIISAVVSWIFMFKTPQGLRLRIVGEDPVAAKSIGINTRKYKYLGILISGFLCGLAGSFLSIDHVNRFVGGMTAGRGYIAVVVNILGRFNPIGVLGSGIMFGFMDSIQVVATKISIPGQFLSMIPYIATLFVISFGIKYVRGPAGIGKSDTAEN